MITRRGVISGLISLFAAPAIVRADSLMKISPQRYATVWGVDRFGNVVKYALFRPMSVMEFGASDAIDDFAEVTGWEYNFPTAPIKPVASHWTDREVIIDPLTRFKKLEAFPTEGVTPVFRLMDWYDLKKENENG
jgi:hypothetical protein